VIADAVTARERLSYQNKTIVVDDSRDGSRPANDFAADEAKILRVAERWRMTNSIGPLRWYAVLAVVFFGIVPAVMVTLLVAGGKTPGQVGFLLIGGIPLVLAAIFYVVRGLAAGSDPELAARLLNRSMALVAGADVLLLGGNALIRMATS